MEKKSVLFAKIKIFSCIGLVLTLFVIGLAFFARPTISENEKRELTKFPTFTVESFLSGEYTSQVSIWFADTYPLREPMIELNSLMQSLYGVRDEQFVSAFNPTDDGKGEGVKGMYLNKDAAYQLYSFDEGKSDRYVSLINDFAASVDGKANVYDMVVPLHYQIALSESTAKKFGASDCEEAIDYMYSNLSSNVNEVDILPYLIEHNNEYLYYRTDHHWTARGAYYAYVAFCKEKGITPTPLDKYKRVKFEGFLGTLYADANQPMEMKKNPDYVEAFIPIGTNEETVYDSNGNVIKELAIVYTGADKYSAGNKYLAFIGGDQPLIKIKNPQINDGSSIVVVKESYGNAFVPFLVDSYEYVYVIDYRHWDGDLADFVTKNKIDDVLFLNVINCTSTGSRLDQLDKIIK